MEGVSVSVGTFSFVQSFVKLTGSGLGDRQHSPPSAEVFGRTCRQSILSILHVAELTGVNEFVKKHSMGYDMEVGELGRGLSGGQRQCVALARAMLLDPPVLVLDEPTSNMDNRTEVLLRDHLSKVITSKTVILITHRASLLEMVDRLVVIDNGTVVADGPKASVLEALKRGQLNV